LRDRSGIVGDQPKLAVEYNCFQWYPPLSAGAIDGGPVFFKNYLMDA
jgi:hypothetical protein